MNNTTTANMTLTASSKVFATPELLEMILLQLTPTHVAPHSWWSHTADDAGISYNAVPQLHALRRVNCTFLSEIERNLLLNQRMLMAPSPRATARYRVVHALRPLGWFLHHTGFGLMGPFLYCGGKSYVDLPTLNTQNLATGVARARLDALTASEGSWKNIPLLEESTGDEVVMSWNIKFAGREPGVSGVHKARDLKCYQQDRTINFEQGMTLGDFWDIMMEYVELDRKSHWMNFKVWQTVEGAVDWLG
jgi:hypothetical protein